MRIIRLAISLFLAVVLASMTIGAGTTRTLRTSVAANGTTTSSPDVGVKAGARLTCISASSADRNNPGTCGVNLTPGGLVVLKPRGEHLVMVSGSVRLTCGGTTPLTCELQISD